jgi:hypothetical protein
MTRILLVEDDEETWPVQFCLSSTIAQRESAYLRLPNRLAAQPLKREHAGGCSPLRAHDQHRTGSVPDDFLFRHHVTLALQCAQEIVGLRPDPITNAPLTPISSRSSRPLWCGGVSYSSYSAAPLVPQLVHSRAIKYRSLRAMARSPPSSAYGDRGARVTAASGGLPTLLPLALPDRQGARCVVGQTHGQCHRNGVRAGGRTGSAEWLARPF